MSGIFTYLTSAASSSSGDATEGGTPAPSTPTPLHPEEDAATPDDAAAVPTDAAHQRHSRAHAPNPYNLRVRHPEGRSVTPQQRLRDRIAARSPSPSPTTSASTFAFPPATMDADSIRALVQETVRASSTAAVQASVASVGAMLPEAVRDVMQSQVRDVTALTRKPELPAFDASNIEIWIRRIENAFTRASITNVKDKFAFLESKIGTSADPKITEYMCADPLTNATWDGFLSYLRKRYGRTKRQQVQSLISGTEFDGLHPSAVVALMKEKAGTVSVDDIIKEHLYRRLPVELQRQLAQEAETMTATELSELADNFYDKDGRPLHAATSSTSVNAIGGGVSNPINPNASSTPTGFTTAFENDQSDINAIRARQNQKQSFNNNNRPQGSNNSRPNNNNNNANSRSFNSNSNDRFSSRDSPKIKPNGLCHYHDKFGEEAKNCANGCKRFSSHQAGKGRAGK